MIKGMDISHWNDIKDGALETLGSYDFVICKASEGKNTKDSKFESYAKNLNKNVNKPIIGAYHYARPELNTYVEDANNFLDIIYKYDGDYYIIGKDLLLALDWEGNALKANIEWALNWLNMVYKETGVKPLIYIQQSELTGTNKNKYKEIADKDYGLWLAKWSEIPPKNIAPWAFWSIHQYKSDPLDHNNFNGTKAQLLQYCRSDKKTPECSKETCMFYKALKELVENGV